MIQKIAFVLGISIMAGILGRIGGTSAGTKWRDIGVSACFCLLLALLGIVNGLKQWLSLLPTFGLVWASLTTYRYFLPKPKDYKWYHYALHGFMVSFAAIFFAWVSGHWFGFGTRCVINAIGVGLISHFVSWDDAEEFSRYFLITLTTPLLLL